MPTQRVVRAGQRRSVGVVADSRARSGRQRARAASAPSATSRSISVRPSGRTTARAGRRVRLHQGHATAAARTGNPRPPGPGQIPLIPDNAHQPSLAYVPYLLTGDRYYAEEMAFWANYGMLRTDPGDGVRGSQGILANNEVRGLRVGAAQSRRRGGLLSRRVAGEGVSGAEGDQQSPVARRLRQQRRTRSSNPFQILWINKRPEGRQYIALWEAELPGAMRSIARTSRGSPADWRIAMRSRGSSSGCLRASPIIRVSTARPICSRLEPRTRPTPQRWRRSIRP